ncbi:MAG: hypothetical protein LQ339_000770 [Xanthoria mediterranea]|nr:MAG: hypothetical protein LQ339_000770 [Xanthoria mediterranea]
MGLDEITFYDLACAPPSKCWSFNPWKTRLVLNYKKIPYTTNFLEMPSIATHHASLSIPANSHSSSTLLAIPYTVPLLKLPTHHYSNSTASDKYIMDSAAIARELETLFPEPALRQDTPAQKKIESLWPQIMRIIGPAILPGITKMLSPLSVEYFISTREAAFGVKISDYDSPQAIEKAWGDVKPLLVELGEVLNAKGGPFVEGIEVTYADFVLVSIMVFLERASSGHIGAVERFVDMDGCFGRLWEACTGWMERDD